MSDVRIKVLGGLEFTGASGKPLTRKAKAVAAFLALQRGQPQSRERLAALFWETSAEEQARTNLRQCLSMLRKHLGGALLTDQDGVLLDPTIVQLDAARFEQLIGEDGIETLEEAAAIYKGDLLDGFAIKEEAFEAWLRPERERYRHLMINGLIRLIGHHETSQDAGANTRTAVRLLALDPLNESVHRTLMRAYAAQGRHGAALKQFEVCRDLLKRELGVEPEQESLVLNRSIRQQRANQPGTPVAEASLLAVDGPPLPDGPSIAVLPFANMSADETQEYFSDGVTEDIITDLSRFSSLFVIARNSSFAYKGQPVDARKIARELGVQYLLEGSVRRADSRIRINAQLIDSVTGNHVWAERYDRVVEDIFDLQEEITRNVVTSLAPQIEIAEIERVRGIQSKDFSAYDLALKAKAILFDGIRLSDSNIVERAIEASEEALKKDSRSVQALWTQGFAYHMLCVWGSEQDQEKLIQRAWTVIERLAEVDSTNPYCCMIRGALYWDIGEYELGIDHLRRGYALNPNSAWNLISLAWCESLAGLMEEAREHAELGLRLSPRDMDFWLGTAHLALAQAHFADKNFKEAKAMGKRALEINSVGSIRRSIVIASCGHLGETDEAASRLQELRSFAPDFVGGVLEGSHTLYIDPQHNELLVEGLRKASL